MDSIDSNPDLELIAALADDRLSGEERARAMKLLAESDEALELYASVLRHQADVRGGDVKVVPISTARRWPRWRVMAPVAAAAAIAIVVVPTLARRGAQADGARAYAEQLTQDPRFTGGLRSGWDERWAATRGGESSVDGAGTRAAGSPQESRLAFRLGVRSVDLQIALSRGDTALAQRLTTEIVETLKGVAFSDLVGASYAELKTHLATDGRTQSVDRAARAERELRDLLGANVMASYSFGQWSAAADLAAQTHDAAFFGSSRGASFLRSPGAVTGLTGEDSAGLRAVDVRVKQGLTDPALDEVHNVVQSIIRRRGG